MSINSFSPHKNLAFIIAVILLIGIVLQGSRPYARQYPQPPGFVTDTLNFTPQFAPYMVQVPRDSVVSLCAVRYRRGGGNVWLDSLELADRATNPTCDPRSAVVLIRPHCLLTLGEFLDFRYRVGYLVIACRPYAAGIPLSQLERRYYQSTE